MSFFESLFSRSPVPTKDKDEVNRLLDELVRIGVKEDYLSEIPGSGYNAQCRHIRTRDIGRKLHEIGGLTLMQWAFKQVRKKAGKVPASHLEYAWTEIGEWQA